MLSFVPKVELNIIGQRFRLRSAKSLIKAQELVKTPAVITFVRIVPIPAQYGGWPKEKITPDDPIELRFAPVFEFAFSEIVKRIGEARNPRALCL